MTASKLGDEYEAARLIAGNRWTDWAMSRLNKSIECPASSSPASVSVFAAGEKPLEKHILAAHTLMHKMEKSLRSSDSKLEIITRISF